jgi:hypothetical protein
VGSVPLDALQFISDLRDDERHQQAVSSAKQHAEANAALRQLELAALDRVRGQNSETAKTLRGMEASVRSAHPSLLVRDRSLLSVLPAAYQWAGGAIALTWCERCRRSSAHGSTPRTAS